MQVIGAPTALHNLTALSLSLLSQKMDFLFRLQTLQDTHHTGEHTAPPPQKKEVFISFEALRTHYKKNQSSALILLLESYALQQA